MLLGSAHRKKIRYNSSGWSSCAKTIFTLTKLQQPTADFSPWSTAIWSVKLKCKVGIWQVCPQYSHGWPIQPISASADVALRSHTLKFFRFSSTNHGRRTHLKRSFELHFSSMTVNSSTRYVLGQGMQARCASSSKEIKVDLELGREIGCPAKIVKANETGRATSTVCSTLLQKQKSLLQTLQTAWGD